MRWDSTRVNPVDTPPDRARARLIWCAPTPAPCLIAQACDLAAIDVIHAADVPACLAGIAFQKPDILVHDLALTAEISDFADQIARRRVTASLPLIAYHGTDGINKGAIPALSDTTSVADTFVTLRAMLRRERPAALKGVRAVNRFVLDEARFKLCHDGQCAVVSKSDQCILGPFFDIPDAVFDKITLAQLAFGQHDNHSRSIDAQVSRMRRHLKTRLGLDPLRTVRGIGYTLSDD